MSISGSQLEKNTDKLQVVEICMKGVQTDIGYIKNNQDIVLKNQDTLSIKFDNLAESIHNQRLQDIAHNETMFAKNHDVHKIKAEIENMNKWIISQKIRSAYIAGGVLIIWFLIQYVLIPLLFK